MLQFKLKVILKSQPMFLLVENNKLLIGEILKARKSIVTVYVIRTILFSIRVSRLGPG